jgi:hypothetical protein
MTFLILKILVLQKKILYYQGHKEKINYNIKTYIVEENEGGFAQDIISFVGRPFLTMLHPFKNIKYNKVLPTSITSHSGFNGLGIGVGRLDEPPPSPITSLHPITYYQLH